MAAAAAIPGTIRAGAEAAVTGAGFYVVVNGQIESARVMGFDCLSAEYFIETGPDWTRIDGLTAGITQMAFRGGSGRDIVWNMPLEASFRTTNAFGWPRLGVAVSSVDGLGRPVIVGYGSTLVPPGPGSYTRTIRLFAPVSSTLLQRFIAWLTANHPRFWKANIVTQGKGREVTRVRSAGSVTVTLHVITRGMTRNGYATGTEPDSLPAEFLTAARSAAPGQPGAIPAAVGGSFGATGVGGNLSAGGMGLRASADSLRGSLTMSRTGTRATFGSVAAAEDARARTPSPRATRAGSDAVRGASSSGAAAPVQAPAPAPAPAVPVTSSARDAGDRRRPPARGGVGDEDDTDDDLLGGAGGGESDTVRAYNSDASGGGRPTREPGSSGYGYGRRATAAGESESKARRESGATSRGASGGAGDGGAGAPRRSSGGYGDASTYGRSGSRSGSGDVGRATTTAAEPPAGDEGERGPGSRRESFSSRGSRGSRRGGGGSALDQFGL